ncbi:hypothetical protein [Spirulina sp. 06S082]|uniref:hypothetical protein n=1 Tax=Spirulina sp. 06S082 TaxID=3110248 RepID=UPI002B1EB744|nr:hypothetical protein [Spirulina sp. 06S082]MEA5469325.1 hypothetical protein [Spirulina sp. 06S082]
MVAFAPASLPASIDTYEKLKLYVDHILYLACRDVAYTNDNGIMESVISSVQWSVQPPSTINTTSNIIDYRITKSAIALQPDHALLPGNFWDYGLEIKNSSEFTIPSAWLT